jgi:hypothetical protein
MHSNLGLVVRMIAVQGANIRVVVLMGGLRRMLAPLKLKPEQGLT